MINIIKEAFDIHVYHPCIVPTILSGLFDGLVSVPVWPVTKGIVTEFWFSDLFQFFGYDRLGNPVLNGGYTQYAYFAIPFGYLLLLYSRRIITTACKTVPHRVQVFLRICFNSFDGYSVYSRSFSFLSYKLKRFPHLFFGDGIRFWSFEQIHSFKLFNLKLIQQLTRLRQSLDSAPITGVSSLLRTDPPLFCRLGIGLTASRLMTFPYAPADSFPCSVTEPGIKSCHLYAGCPS